MSGPRPHRARDDFVHDPPHGIRAQHRELAHTEMGADIRSRYASAGAAMPPLVRSLGLGDPSSVSRPAMAHHFRPNALKQGITTRRSRAYNVQFGSSGQTAVASWQDDTSIVALDSRTWRVRAKATGRDIAWTITATELSPDERCVAYSTINDVAHVIRLQDPADTDMDGEDGEGDMEDGVGISGDHDGGGGGDGEEGEDAPAVLGAPFSPSSSFSPSSRSPHAHRRRLISLPSAAPAGHSSASFSASSSASSSSRELGVASHTPMDFSVEARGAAPQGAGGYRGRSSRGSFGIFSLKWSAGGGEVVAGCNDGQLRIFDVESGVVSDRVQAHQDDINSVCFAGTGAASDVVISGSDEVGTPLKVWDRRALGRPVGGLPGHVAGVTHVSPRGDGVHVLSASKDQTIKLWDLRKQLAPDHARAVAARASRAWKSFDYRWEAPSYRQRSGHPSDLSIATLTGPVILQTLIRAYFSPLESTGARYVYSGSADGAVYMFDLHNEGDLCARLTHHKGPVRDVSWHPQLPVLLSASFDGTLGVWTYRDEGAAQQAAVARDWRKLAKWLRRANRAARKATRESRAAALALAQQEASAPLSARGARAAARSGGAAEGPAGAGRGEGVDGNDGASSYTSSGASSVPSGDDPYRRRDGGGDDDDDDEKEDDSEGGGGPLRQSGLRLNAAQNSLLARLLGLVGGGEGGAGDEEDEEDDEDDEYVQDDDDDDDEDEDDEDDDDDEGEEGGTTEEEGKRRGADDE
jgi:WD40 repeat protein